MRALLLACLTTLILGSCGDAPTAVDLSGTYHLVSIDDMPPPILWEDNQVLRTVITSGAIVLGKDNSFEDRVSGTDEFAPPSEPRPWTEAAYGTWTIQGRTLSMTYSASGPFAGPTHQAEVSNGRITQEYQGARYVYQK